MKFLIVDVSNVIRNLIPSYLQGMDFEFFQVESISESLQLCSQHSFDFIITSVHLKDGSGYDLCFKLRNAENDSPYFSSGNSTIIIMTSNDTLQEREKGYQVGATEFLLKNSLETSLRQRIEQILHPRNIFSSAHILLVDDSDLNRLMVRQLLKRKVKKITEAETGLQALQCLTESGDEFDMILTDFYMPELNGPELCQKIRKMRSFQELPVIILSGADERSEILQIFKSGANDFLMKPFIKEELIARIEIHLKAYYLSRNTC